MSKHHQASRRRSYRRRQHELYERADRREHSPTDRPEEREEPLLPDETRAGLVRWPMPAWAGLR